VQRCLFSLSHYCSVALFGPLAVDGCSSKRTARSQYQQAPWEANPQMHKMAKLPRNVKLYCSLLNSKGKLKNIQSRWDWLLPVLWPAPKAAECCAKALQLQSHRANSVDGQTLPSSLPQKNGWCCDAGELMSLSRWGYLQVFDICKYFFAQLQSFPFAQSHQHYP